MRRLPGSANPTSRRIALGGLSLETGKHEVELMTSRGALPALVVVGARRGPRAFVVGGFRLAHALGLAIGRAGFDALDPALLAGSVVLVGRADPTGSTPDAAAAAQRVLTERAAFGVEVRSGAAGKPSWPHLGADLRDERTARLARAFGCEVILDVPPARGTVRRGAGVPVVLYEAGEDGRHDTEAVARGVAGLLNLLRARKMLPGHPIRPAFRATVSKAVWVQSEGGGWLVPQVSAGDMVTAGQSIATLHDASGRTRGPITAPHRGVVLAMSAAAHVTAGSAVARVARIRSSILAPPSAGVSAAGDPPRIGWCEWVALPDLGIPRLHAKIDTGARTSALHVGAMRHVGEIAGRPVLEIQLPSTRRSARAKPTLARVVVEEYVVVRDSGGHAERRPVIRTTLALGPLREPIRVTLTDRGDMLFPMLIGRTAVAEKFIIDASARHLLGD